MPFVFLILGVVLLIIAIQGTHAQFFSLLKSEFTGSNNFLVWIAALAIIGALGFIRPIRPIALGMMGLILLVIILKNGGGFFAQFNQQIANPVAPATGSGSGSGFSLPSLFTTVPGNPASLAPGAASPQPGGNSPLDNLGIPLGFST